MKRWQGTRALVGEAIEHGSRAVERVQLELAKTPFDLLERVPGLKVPVSGIRELYNTGVSSTHTMIRLATKVAGDTVGVVLDAVSPGEKAAGQREEAVSSGEKAAGQREEAAQPGSMQNSTQSPS